MPAGDVSVAGSPAGVPDAPDPPGPPASRNRRRLVVVHPSVGDGRSGELASRLRQAASLIGFDAVAVTAPDLGPAGASWTDGSTALVVDPAVCARSSRDGLGLLSRARFRAAVAPRGVTSAWLRSVADAGLEFDAVVDIGFVDRGSPRTTPALGRAPGRFLVNAPLPGERALIEAREPPSGRPLSWALVAAGSREGVELADELLGAFGPRCFLFLPPTGAGQSAAGMLGPGGVGRVLERATLGVSGAGDFDGEESLWFLDAVRSGAVPCPIGATSPSRPGGAPRVYPTVGALEDELARRGIEELFEESRAYALAQGTLPDHLDELLGHV